MPAYSDEPTRPAAASSQRRIRGPVFVVAGLAAAAGLMGVLILIVLLAVDDPGPEEQSCAEQPAVCGTVEAYAAAFNARDAAALRSVLTDHGMQSLLQATSEEELRERLGILTPADRIEDIEFTRVNLDEDEARVVAVFKLGDDEFNAIYRLVRSGESWLIDE